jgi:hypothetical protein
MCRTLVFKQKPANAEKYHNNQITWTKNIANEQDVCTRRCNITYRNMGLFSSLFMIIASNIGPSRITNSIIRCINMSRFLQSKQKQHILPLPFPKGAGRPANQHRPSQHNTQTAGTMTLPYHQASYKTYYHSSRKWSLVHSVYYFWHKTFPLPCSDCLETTIFRNKTPCGLVDVHPQFVRLNYL